MGTKLWVTVEVGPGSERVGDARSLGDVRCRRMSGLMRRFSADGHTSALACVDTLRSQLCIGLRSIEVTAPRLKLERSENRSHSHSGTADRTAPDAHLDWAGCDQWLRFGRFADQFASDHEEFGSVWIGQKSKMSDPNEAPWKNMLHEPAKKLAGASVIWRFLLP